MENIGNFESTQPLSSLEQNTNFISSEASNYGSLQNISEPAGMELASEVEIAQIDSDFRAESLMATEPILKEQTTQDSNLSNDEITGTITEPWQHNITSDEITGTALSQQLSSSYDNAPPTIKFMAADITKSGGKDYVFTINYGDETTIDKTTFDNKDILVTGPNEFSQLAELVNVEKNSDGSSQAVTYRIDAPSNYWNISDRGTYSIDLQANQVSDTNGNFISANTLDTFDVNPNPGTIKTEPTILINEKDKTAKVTIERIGGSEGNVKVDYSTVDGTASEGLDYNEVSGTLNFAHGETSKTIKIPILEDTKSEVDETFNLSLDKIEGGALLETPENTIFTIVDNNSSVGTKNSSLENRYLFTLDVKLDNAIPIGTSSQGDRNIFDIVPGGTAKGPAIQGSLLESGGEYLTTRPDGVAVLDARAAIKTNDNQLIYTEISGFSDNFAETIPSFLDEDQTNNIQPDYLGLKIDLETGSQRYSWLNQIVAVGKGTVVSGNNLRFDVYQVL
ncbi:MAG: hypothetical protein RLZZ04_1900 [Cyanobacteriota bacterium]|jgi:hypothetical protein